MVFSRTSFFLYTIEIHECSMKTSIICSLALLVLVKAQNGIHAQPHLETELRGPSPYERLLRTGTIRNEIRNVERICEPQSTKKADCNHCFCVGDGSGWACTEMLCLPAGHFHPEGFIRQSDTTNTLYRTKRAVVSIGLWNNLFGETTHKPTTSRPRKWWEPVIL